MSEKIVYKEFPLNFPGRFIGVQTLTGNWRTQRPVIDHNKCRKCGLCQLWCPDASIYIKDEIYYINYKFCKGCGICENECPAKAIKIVREEFKIGEKDDEKK